MLRNTAFADWITANPLLVDAERVALFNAHLTHLSMSEEFQKLFAAHGDDDFWNPYGEGQHPYRPYIVTNGILQVLVQGVLLNKFSYQFGRYATGYQYIEKAVMRGLSDPGVRGIALVTDSPGGEVAGCFELADKIHEAREGKPIRAYAMDHAYSAAYALASSAQEIVVSRSGGTGSVGVLTAHADYSEALAQIGIKVTFIFAGDHKVDGNPYEKLPDVVKSRIQDRINKIYGVFTGTVARNRGMDEEAVRKTQALTYDADDSVAVGFADRIGSLDEELVAFADSFDEADDEQLQDQEEIAMTPEQIQAAIATARAEGQTEGEKAGATKERERVQAIMGSDAAKARPKLAQSMVSRGVDTDTALALLADAPEEKAQVEEPKGKQPTGFTQAMDQGDNPNVGADSTGNTEPVSAEDKAVAGLLGDVGAFYGRKPGKAA